MKSPFFRPSERPHYEHTPGGTRHRRKPAPGVEEKKSTILGCSANLVNAIVGSGIVGLPYAVSRAGFVAGVALVVLCALLTEKSLRLLVETAKHAHVPSYEMVSEAAFGRVGFLFVAINMFIMAYGAMVSYLMIVKDTFSSLLGIAMDDYPVKRAILFVVSIVIIVPLSSQRDMASLSKTSRLNVTFDFLIVLIVIYCGSLQSSYEDFKWEESIIHYDTVFVGLGVLSFAFVCQHSAFIIAGSLERPTKTRWSTVTKTALIFCAVLALSCGIGGYVGFGDKAPGNILNALDNSLPAKVARGLLGTTMLFVYPMESFVARHVCVVLLFKGKSAHEGDDSTVLDRRDRRITLTMILYLMAVIPAGFFEELGTILAAVGAIGGSSMSYVGPGLVYLGIHGGRFLELSRSFFGKPDLPGRFMEEETVPLYNTLPTGVASDTSSDEATPLRSGGSPNAPADSCIIVFLKGILWYLWLMPLWCKIAAIGRHYLTSHVHDLALKSPIPIRIGNVRFASAKIRGGATRVVMLGDETKKAGDGSNDQNSDFPTDTMLIRADSLPRGYGTARTAEGRIVALPPTPTGAKILASKKLMTNKTQGNQSVNSTIGAALLAKRQQEEEELALEDDPQETPPGVGDFLIAIFYVVFGIVAMVVGLASIYAED